MAEIQSQQLQQKYAGVQRSKKLSTRVDLTPMVDLGFLLITFFIFTTSLSQPMSMHLNMPQEKDVTDPMILTETKVLTLVLKDDKTVGYYYGSEVQHMQFTNYGTGLRDVIMQKKAAVAQRYGKPDDLVILIKPTDSAVYRDVIAALDEMAINDVHVYMLLDASVEENKIAFK